MSGSGASSSPAATEATRLAFETFLDRGARGRDWPAWAALFTDDAVYTEHCMGRFVGRKAIEAWILSAMEPVACMTFSAEWFIVEGDMVAFWIWNHLPDPDPSAAARGEREFCFPNLTVLTHAGGLLWSAEEDIYESAWTACVIDWFRAGGSAGMVPDPGLRPGRPTHPSPPAAGPDRAVVAALLAALAPAGATLRHDIVEGAVGVGVFDTDERAYAVIAHVDAGGTVVFSDVVANPQETINRATPEVGV